MMVCPVLAPSGPVPTNGGQTRRLRPDPRGPRAHNSFLNSPLSPFAAPRHPFINMPNP